jgi:hypothetical protein
MISPTYDSNAAFHILPVERGDVYKDASDAQHALRDILNKTDQDAGQYKRWERYEKVYKARLHNPDRLSEKDIDLAHVHALGGACEAGPPQSPYLH